MSVKNVVQKGKIIESEVPKILVLVGYYLEAFYYNYLRLKDSQELLRRDVGGNNTEERENISKEMFLLSTQLCAASRQLLYFHAEDLYEFFYLKREPELGEYFYYHFPIDIEKYEKERVPEKKIKELLKNKNNLDEEIVSLLRSTSEIFYKCLDKKYEKNS